MTMTHRKMFISNNFGHRMEVVVTSGAKLYIRTANGDVFECDSWILQFIAAFTKEVEKDILDPELVRFKNAFHAPIEYRFEDTEGLMQNAFEVWDEGDEIEL